LDSGDRAEITKAGIRGENESDQEFAGAWIKVRNVFVISAAMQTAPTDKLLNPLRCGGKSKGIHGLCNAERCLRSLSRQIPAFTMKTLAKDTALIGKSDRLLAGLSAEKSGSRA
jgi:hypothetical protein